MAVPPTITPRIDVEGKRFGPRALAYIIDLIVVNLTNIAVGLVGAALFGIVLYILAALAGYQPLIGTPPTGINFAVGILISFAYFIAFEALCGATPGKAILGMRVATVNGDRPPFYGAMVRALWRLFDGLFFGLVAASSMKSPLHQRYGDKHAMTLVLASNSPILRYKLSVPLFFFAALLYLAASLLLQVASVLAYTTYHPLPAAQEYFDRGYAAYEKGDLDQAIEDLTKAIELDPNFAEAYFYRGGAYIAKDPDRAVADLNKAIELDPSNAEAYDYRGRAYNNKGSFDQALADYNKAIELDPNLAPAYNDRGTAYYGNGNFDKAITDHNKAIELDPKFALAYYNRGIVYTTQGNLEQAIADYTKAIELDPKYERSYYYRGLAYANLGELDQSITDLTKAIELDPKDVGAYIDRGSAFFAQGNLDQAIADYTKAIELDPENVVAYFNRGYAYYQEGLKAEAIADFETYLRLAPSVPERGQVEQWLSELKGK